MEEIEIEIEGQKYSVPKPVADALTKMRAEMDAMASEKAEGEKKLDAIRGEKAGLEGRLDAMASQLKTLTDDLAAKRLDALKADLCTGLPAEQALRVKTAPTPKDAYREALPAPVLARLDATTGEEGYRAAFQATRAAKTDGDANAARQADTLQGARSDAASSAPKQNPIGRFTPPPAFDPAALRGKQGV